MTREYYAIGCQAWPMGADPNRGKDLEIGNAIWEADKTLKELRRAYQHVFKSIGRVSATLSFGNGGPPERYSAEYSKKYDILQITLNGDLERLRKLEHQEIVQDIAIACLRALRDALHRRKMSVQTLDSALSKLGPAPTGSGFLNLLGDIDASHPEPDAPFEVSVSIPLEGSMPAKSELRTLQRIDLVLKRELRREGVGTFEAREVGGGSSEYIITCKKVRPVLKTLRRLFKDGLFQDEAKVVVYNRRTETTTVHVLRS